MIENYRYILIKGYLYVYNVYEYGVCMSIIMLFIMI